MIGLIQLPPRLLTNPARFGLAYSQHCHSLTFHCNFNPHKEDIVTQAQAVSAKVYKKPVNTV